MARWLVRVMDAQRPWVRPLGEVVHRIDHAIFHAMPPVRDLLNGRWLGHPIHAVLTDVPIGILFLVIVFDVVSAIVPAVRPWKEPANTMMFCFPDAARASFTAPSTASAPEFEKKKPSISGGTTVRSSSISLNIG